MSRPPSRDATDQGAAPTARLLRSLGEVADHLVSGITLGDAISAIEDVLVDAIPDVSCSVVLPAAPALLSTSAWVRPLTAADGVTIGHLVVRPAVPREPTDDELALLDLVARLALIGVLRCADVALQEAERHGRGQVVVREPRADEPDARAVVELEQAIRHPTADGQLRVHYQPIVRCSDDRVVCYETLVRWLHPVRGMLSPDAFLGMARDAGLVDEIDRWVLGTAAAEVARWPTAADALAPSVTVNLDARASVSACAKQRLLTLVQESGLPPHRLVVEITEHVFADDQREVVRTLSELRSHGIRVAIDDFGTGWSSLHRLRSVPLDMLKVDRSFIADLGQRAEAAALLDAIVTMGHALGLEIIAEGIETAEQMDEVRRLGCDMAQGFLLGRPAPASEVAGAHLTIPVTDR